MSASLNPPVLRTSTPLFVLVAWSLAAIVSIGFTDADSIQCKECKVISYDISVNSISIYYCTGKCRDVDMAGNSCI